jgi:hypothetical protein
VPPVVRQRAVVGDAGEVAPVGEEIEVVVGGRDVGVGADVGEGGEEAVEVASSFEYT